MKNLTGEEFSDGMESLITESRTVEFDVHDTLRKRMSENDVEWVQDAITAVVHDFTKHLRHDHPDASDDEIKHLLQIELAHPLFKEKIDDFLLVLGQKDHWLNVTKAICTLMINAKARISSIDGLQLESLLDDHPMMSEALEKLSSENARHLLMHKICLGLLCRAAVQSSIAARMDEGDFTKKPPSTPSLHESVMMNFVIERAAWRITAAMFDEDIDE